MPVEQEFPETLVLVPAATHKRTFILLHGRGSKAGILANETASIQQAFPHAKLIFPQARKQRATVYKKSITRQWFDDWHLNTKLQSTDVVSSSYDEGLQTSELGESVSYLHDLIRTEAVLVGGAQNVVVGGFSQGAAASLVAALLWDGSERLGGLVAMSGWLPYVRQMTDVLDGGDGYGQQDTSRREQRVESFDPFERPASPKEERNSVGTVEAALRWLREEIDMLAEEFPRQHLSKTEQIGTPVLFCHGLEDHQVEPNCSQVAAEFLPRLAMGSVEWKFCADLGHEVSEEMVAHLVVFLKTSGD